MYLVPEEAESLAELEVLEVVLLHERDPDCIQAGEQPTAARSLLVRDRLHFVDLIESDFEELHFLKESRENNV